MIGYTAIAIVLFILVRSIIDKKINGALKSKNGKINRAVLSKAQPMIKAWKLKIYISYWVSALVIGIVVFTVVFILESTTMQRYSTGALIDMLFGDKTTEEESEYPWEFEDFEDPNEDGENGEGGWVTVSERDAFLDVVYKEWEYYSTNNIRGGAKYWEWCNANTGSTGPDEWCAMFVRYCIENAGITGEGHTIPDGSKFTYLCETIFNNMKSGAIPGTWYTAVSNGSGGVNWTDSNGKSVSVTPEPGDIMLYWKRPSSPTTTHINVVYEVDSSGKVRTIGGNEGANGKGFWYSVVRKPDYLSYGGLEGWWYKSVLFRPDWKTTQVYDPNASGGGSQYIGSFDISNYPTDSSGYYDEATTEQILYDFFRIEMGYNSAAAAGAITNLYCENGFNYDQLEVANFGKAYKAKSLSAAYFNVPYSYGRGNYKGIPDIENTMKFTGNLWYANSDKTGFVYYGMGYGLCAWSFGRRAAFSNFCQSNGYGSGMGGSGLAGQLAFMKYELENSYSHVNSQMLAVPDTSAGAREAAKIWSNKYEICLESLRPIRWDLAETTYWKKWGGKPVSQVAQQPGDTNFDPDSSTNSGSFEAGINIMSQGGLLDIANPDSNYKRKVLKLSDADRDTVERLVMGEAGGEGFIGAALVAQTIKDNWFNEGPYNNMLELKNDLGYTASLTKTPNEDTLKAVRYIFDQGGYAVQHKVYVFYSGAYQEWHESQVFVVEYKAHRIFDKRV